jgi:hypothetical protein
MVEQDQLRAKMRDVLESVREDGAIQLPAEGEPFLVLNPGYHDGNRASFLVLPTAFCESTLFSPRGLQRQDVWTSPIGRLFTVTDRGIVLTVTAAQRMVHVTCDVIDEFRKLKDVDNTCGSLIDFNLGDNGATMGSLDDAARADGWLVPWSDFDAVTTDVARHYGLTTSYSHLMKLPPGVVKGSGGES